MKKQIYMPLVDSSVKQNYANFCCQTLLAYFSAKMDSDPMFTCKGYSCNVMDILPILLDIEDDNKEDIKASIEHIKSCQKY